MAVDAKLRIKGEDDTKQAWDSVTRNAKRAGAGVAKAAGAAAAGLAAIGFVAVRVTKDLDSLAKAARVADLGTDTFQSWRIQAELAGVSIGDFDKAMERANRTIGDARAGLGTGRQFLDDFGISLNDAQGNARSTEAVLRDYVDTLGDMDSAQDKSAASAALFGRAGAKLAPLFSDGTASLDDFTEAARQAGLIIDGQTLRAAEGFNDQLTILGKLFDAGLAASLADVIPVLIGITNSFLKGIPAVAGWIDQVFRFSEESKITARIKQFQTEVDLLNRTLADGGKAVVVLGVQVSGPRTEEARKKLVNDRNDLKKLIAEEERKREDLANNSLLNIDKLLERINAQGTAALGPAIGGDGATLKLPGVTFDDSDFLAGNDEFVDGNPIQEIIDNALEDADLRFDQILADAAAKVDADQELGDSLYAVINDGVTAGYRDGFDGLLDYFQDSIADALLQSLTDTIFKGLEGTGLGNLFGSIFGRASGGRVRPDQAYLVGENGPELLTGANGFIIPQGSSGGGGGSPTVQNFIEFGSSGDRGRDEETMQRLKEEVTSATIASFREIQRQGRA